jgi:hypothetical protein
MPEPGRVPVQFWSGKSNGSAKHEREANRGCSTLRATTRALRIGHDLKALNCCSGGRGRTRTYEGVSQRIYSPPPLPLGTLSRTSRACRWANTLLDDARTAITRTDGNSVAGVIMADTRTVNRRASGRFVGPAALLPRRRDPQSPRPYRPWRPKRCALWVRRWRFR